MDTEFLKKEKPDSIVPFAVFGIIALVLFSTLFFLTMGKNQNPEVLGVAQQASEEQIASNQEGIKLQNSNIEYEDNQSSINSILFQGDSIESNQTTKRKPDIFEKTKYYTISAYLPKNNEDPTGFIKQKIDSLILEAKGAWKDPENPINEQEYKSSVDQGTSAPYELNLDYSIPTNTLDGFKNLVVSEYVFQNGAHGFTQLHIYNLKDGKQISVPELFGFSESDFQNLSQLMSQKLISRKSKNDEDVSRIESGLRVKYIDNEGKFDRVVCECEDFKFEDNFKFLLVEKDGIRVIFHPYKVDSYSAGFQDVLLSWSDLQRTPPK